ncbi:MAG: rRNA maturation RNase YbeY, partial [Acaryochloridaceae cyanobacterium RL_2_7]|nr:rRNA maturation RNase YbeY [Acaryochloridaceae cyanobacterium RL_2_7]
LAFASLEREALPPEIWNSQPIELGDIIISVETADRQAQEQNHSLKQEIAWLASHGLLHLLGWDHPDPERLEEMLTQQHQLLTCVGLH